MVTSRQIEILKHINLGKTLRHTASEIGISHPAVLKHLKKMITLGLLNRVSRSSGVIYSLTLAGRELLSQAGNHEVTTPEESLTGGSDRLPPPEKIPDQIRLHRLQVKFDLLNPIKDPSIISYKDHPSKIVPLTHWMKNIIEFEDFTAIISTKSLIISGVQRYIKISENLESKEASILSAIVPLAEQIEEKVRRSQPKFKLKRLAQGVLQGRILSREYAYEHHPIAEKVKKMEIKDSEDGKPRIIVDQSKGFPELETVHKEYAAEDMNKIKNNTLFMARYDLEDVIFKITDTQYETAKRESVSQDKFDQMLTLFSKIAEMGGFKQ